MGVPETTVAVIDNDQDLVALMSELLQAREFTPLTAGTIACAWDVIRTGNPALILLDLWLESPDAGWTMIQQLRSTPETVSIPIIVVTGGMHLLGDERIAWLRDNGIEILPKPFDLDQFDRCIDTALAGQV